MPFAGGPPAVSYGNFELSTLQPTVILTLSLGLGATAALKLIR